MLPRVTVRRGERGRAAPPEEKPSAAATKRSSYASSSRATYASAVTTTLEEGLTQATAWLPVTEELGDREAVAGESLGEEEVGAAGGWEGGGVRPERARHGWSSRLGRERKSGVAIWWLLVGCDT